jgi:hypothetical protein
MVGGIILPEPGIKIRSKASQLPGPPTMARLRVLRPRRRFDPSSSPSASQIWGAVLSGRQQPKISQILPMFLFGRIEGAASVALDRGWRMHFSPQPSYQVRKSSSQFAGL